MTFTLTRIEDLPRDKGFAWAMGELANGHSVSRVAWGRMVRVFAVPAKQFSGVDLPSEIRAAIGGPGAEHSINIPAHFLRLDRAAMVLEPWLPSATDMAAHDWHPSLSTLTEEEYQAWIEGRSC